jgi:FAD/FMN-containing dehydrogenase
VTGIAARDWTELGRRLGSRLIDVDTPLRACLIDPDGEACAEAIAALANPFVIEGDPGAFHTTGWRHAFDACHSPKAVAAESTDDVAAAVRFCADRGLRVVAKGTGHDYLGRSSDPDALTVWTHHMREIEVHDAFSPQGANPADPGVAAISLGAGVRWLEAYQALQPSGRYVQGGGCTSVGVAGFTLGGGFGSFSRRFGTAAGNLIEAEVVTATGETLVANANVHPDLFWALRGGGFGLAIVTRLTMRTHHPPPTLGAVAGTVKANDANAYKRLIRRLVDLFPSLCDDHWGEQVRFLEDHSVELGLVAAAVSEDEAKALWEPFFSWVAARPEDYRSNAFVVVTPFEAFWDASVWDTLAPEIICHDQRPGRPAGRFWWASNQGEVSQYLHAYQSRWLPARLLTEGPEQLADALFEATRHWRVSLHFNKALCGAAPDALARERTTCVNPAVFDSAALVISASAEQYVFPGIPGHEPDLELAARRAERVTAAMAPIRAITPGAGSYVNETNYFEENWQDSFWGDNYGRLLVVKQEFDPANVFNIHHAVGNEPR